MYKSDNPLLVDVPDIAVDKFYQVLKKLPACISVHQTAKASHTGRGTSWAGGYREFEIYDENRPEWATELAEEFAEALRDAVRSVTGRKIH